MKHNKAILAKIISLPPIGAHSIRASQAWKKTAGVQDSLKQKFHEAARKIEDASIPIVPLILCDVNGTLLNNIRGEMRFNSALYDILLEKEQQGRVIQIYSANPQGNKKLLKEFGVASHLLSIAEKSPALIYGLNSYAKGNRRFEMLIDDDEMMAKVCYGKAFINCVNPIDLTPEFYK